MVALKYLTGQGHQTDDEFEINSRYYFVTDRDFTMDVYVSF